MLIAFGNGYHLAYDSQRKLGLIDLTKDIEAFIADKQLGTDPFRDDLSFGEFRKLFEGRRGSIKTSLMNQELIAGIGNVYSDEILFQSGIHPASRVRNISEKQLHTIFRELQRVLRTAIDKQVDPSHFPESFLLGHREPGEKCPMCDGTIKKESIGGRSSYFCNTHQKRVD
jgi:formamidopyrimidine-DNA glycosylase